MTGVLIGLKDIYISEITEGTFGTPERLAKAIEAKVTPNVSNVILYADDGAAESASSEGETEIELGIASLPNAMYAKLLGKTINTDGVVEDSSGDQPIDVALGFRSLKSNGKYRYIWFYKGKFQLPEENYKTKGESVEYNTPTIKGTFVHSDKVLNKKGEGIKRVVVDEDDDTVLPAITAAWFTKVYEHVPTP